MKDASARGGHARGDECEEHVQARCMFNRFPRRAVTANGAFRAVLTIDSDDNITCEGPGQAGRGAALFRTV